MEALLEAEARPDVADQLARVRRALFADALIPYLGPGLLVLSGARLPSTPEAVAPARIRTNMWSAAQFIESRRHRKTLQAFMADIFAAPAPPPPLLDFLARLPLALIVNAWYDDAFASALRAADRRDVIEIQGVARAGVRGDVWTQTYDADGALCDASAADTARTALYSPHGGVRPARNFLVADSGDGEG
jgi:hypothetical protein